MSYYHYNTNTLDKNYCKLALHCTGENCVLACGGMDNMCTIYDLNNRDSNGGAKMVRELLGYEGFLSSCRFVDDKTLITGSGDMKL